MGATPWPQSAIGSPFATGHRSAGTSPPGPFRWGSTTCSVNPVATAASNALPPRSSTAIPAAEASQCVEATIPNVPRSSGRVVKLKASPEDQAGRRPVREELAAPSVTFPSAVTTREPLWITIPSQRIRPVSALIGRTKFVFTSSVV